MNQTNEPKQVETTALATRLPMPPSALALGLDQATWKVLVEAVWPTATDPDAIALAVSYCRARGLDPLKRVVHIVPIWDPTKGRYVNTVWPGIAEARTTAARTGAYGGRDATVFGPDVEVRFGDDLYVVPEWAQVTVYRIVQGQRVPFVGPRVYWRESVVLDRDGKPNKMWTKRPRGQLDKCAERAALAVAFPEELGDQPIEADGPGIYQSVLEENKPVFQQPQPISEATQVGPVGPGPKPEACSGEPVVVSLREGADVRPVCPQNLGQSAQAGPQNGQEDNNRGKRSTAGGPAAGQPDNSIVQPARVPAPATPPFGAGASTAGPSSNSTDTDNRMKLREICARIAQAQYRIDVIQGEPTPVRLDPDEPVDPAVLADQVCVALSGFKGANGQWVEGRHWDRLAGKWLATTLHRAERIWDKLHKEVMAEVEQRAQMLLPDPTEEVEQRPQTLLPQFMVHPPDVEEETIPEDSTPVKPQEDPLTQAIKRRRGKVGEQP